MFLCILYFLFCLWSAFICLFLWHSLAQVMISTIKEHQAHWRKPAWQSISLTERAASDPLGTAVPMPVPSQVTFVTLSVTLATLPHRTVAKVPGNYSVTKVMQVIWFQSSLKEFLSFTRKWFNPLVPNLTELQAVDFKQTELELPTVLMFCTSIYILPFTAYAAETNNPLVQPYPSDHLHRSAPASQNITGKCCSQHEKESRSHSSNLTCSMNLHATSNWIKCIWNKSF